MIAPEELGLERARETLATMMRDLGYQPTAERFDDLIEECWEQITSDLRWALLNSSPGFSRSAALMAPRKVKDAEPKVRGL